MRRLGILLFFVLIVCLTRTSEARKLAMLVGVDEYTRLHPLRCCVNDVVTLKEALMKIGFKEANIHILKTGTSSIREQPIKQNIEQLAEDILADTEPSDIVFFAFCGHGLRDDETDYFCPPEANPSDMKGSCVSITKIMSDMAKCKAKLKWMVVDACRNNSANSRDVRGIGIISKVPTGILLFQSCDKGEKSYEEEREGGNGYFTKNFAAALSGAADVDHDGQLTLGEVCVWTATQTEAEVKKMEHASQRPHLKGEYPPGFVLTGDGRQDPPPVVAEKPSKITVPDDCLTIEEAYAKVKDGGVITIKPGKYELSQMLVVNRNVTFRGDTSDPENVVIECSVWHTFHITGGSPSFQNLTVNNIAEPRDRETHKDKDKDGDEAENRDESKECPDGFYITCGTPKLFHCIITSREGVGIDIEGKEANPTVEKCIMKNSVNGVTVQEEARGEFSGCEIYGNTFPGIGVKDLGNPTFTGCKIHDGKKPGIMVLKSGRGEFRDCDIYGNEYPGIVVLDSGNPTFTGCKIHDGKQCGVFIIKKGLGVFRDCAIYGNAMAGIQVQESGNPTFTECKIHDGKDAGVVVLKNGLGTFTDCEIYGNMNAGITVLESGNPTVARCKIHDGKNAGVFVHQEGLGVFRDCEIYQNSSVGIGVRESGNPTVTWCKIHDGKSSGILIFDKGMGTFDQNTLSKNYLNGKLSNWNIQPSASKVKGSGNTPELPKH